MVIFLEDYVRRHRRRGTALLVTATPAAGARLARPNRSAPPAARALAPAALALVPESIDLPAAHELNTVYAEATLI